MSVYHPELMEEQDSPNLFTLNNYHFPGVVMAGFPLDDLRAQGQNQGAEELFIQGGGKLGANEEIRVLVNPQRLQDDNSHNNGVMVTMTTSNATRSHDLNCHNEEEEQKEGEDDQGGRGIRTRGIRTRGTQFKKEPELEDEADEEEGEEEEEEEEDDDDEEELMSDLGGEYDENERGMMDPDERDDLPQELMRHGNGMRQNRNGNNVADNGRPNKRRNSGNTTTAAAAPKKTTRKTSGNNTTGNGGKRRKDGRNINTERWDDQIKKRTANEVNRMGYQCSDPDKRELLAAILKRKPLNFSSEYERLNNEWLVKRCLKRAQVQNAQYLHFVKHIPSKAILVVCEVLKIKQGGRLVGKLREILEPIGFSLTKLLNGEYPDISNLRPEWISSKSLKETFASYIAVFHRTDTTFDENRTHILESIQKSLAFEMAFGDTEKLVIWDKLLHSCQGLLDSKKSQLSMFTDPVHVAGSYTPESSSSSPSLSNSVASPISPASMTSSPEDEDLDYIVSTSSPVNTNKRSTRKRKVSNFNMENEQDTLHFLAQKKQAV